jgi:hypothetical protein
MAFYLFFGSAVFGLRLAGESLSVTDRETITWVDENIPSGSNFLLLTGEQYSMNDPFQEWFPALTGQRSQTTLQGKEWTLEEKFFPFYGELIALQHCSDIDCVDTWEEQNELGYQYLLINKLSEGSASPLRVSLALLLESIKNSGKYAIIHETGNAVIFEYMP